VALRSTVLWSGLGGTPYFSTFHSQLDSSGTHPQDFATAVATTIENLEILVSNNLSWSLDPTVTVFDPATGTATAAFTVTPASGDGTDTAPTLPRFTQGLVQARTGVFNGGRETRGKFYSPGPTEANNDDDGTPGSDYLTTLDLIFTTHLLEADVGWAVWSRVNGLMVLVNDVSVSQEWAYLSSRRD